LDLARTLPAMTTRQRLFEGGRSNAMAESTFSSPTPGIEGNFKPIPEYPIEVFDRVIAVNVRGVWLGLKHVIPVMGQGWRRKYRDYIINCRHPWLPSGASAYVTSKHAVIGMMRTAGARMRAAKDPRQTHRQFPAAHRDAHDAPQSKKQLAPGHPGQAKEQFQSTLSPSGR